MAFLKAGYTAEREHDHSAETEAEGKIREFVRRDVVSNPGCQLENDSQLVASNINSVLQQVTETSVQEIDKLITDLQALFDRIRDDHARGFSIVDEELERGLRSIAVAVVDRQNQAVGALNLETHATRTTRNEMRDKFLPELRAVAAQIAPFVA